jgi:hypothetical protein
VSVIERLPHAPPAGWRSGVDQLGAPFGHVPAPLGLGHRRLAGTKTGCLTGMQICAESVVSLTLFER